MRPAEQAAIGQPGRNSFAGENRDRSDFVKSGSATSVTAPVKADTTKAKRGETASPAETVGSVGAYSRDGTSAGRTLGRTGSTRTTYEKLVQKCGR